MKQIKNYQNNHTEIEIEMMMVTMTMMSVWTLASDLEYTHTILVFSSQDEMPYGKEARTEQSK